MAPALPALQTIGTVLSAVKTAQGLFKKDKPPGAPRPAQEPPFSPQRPDALARPESLNEFSAFSPQQQRTALATTGVNSGLGKDEDAYYRNLLNRSLIGDGNKVDTANPDFLMPVESQYFSRQGVNTSNIMEFLKGIR